MRRRELLIVLGAIAAPRAVRSQQRAMPVIGYLSGGSSDYYVPYVTAFRRGLREANYVEGENLAIEFRWAEGRYDRLPAMAADLVGRKVDVIVASGGDLASRAARDATSTIPIVFSAGGDPVVGGLVTSLARPERNLTGITFFAVGLNPKRLELLAELVPKAGTIALLANPKSPNTARVLRDMLESARAKGFPLVILEASSEGEIDAAFDALVQRRAGALIVDPDPFIDSRREQLTALAARHAVPAIYAFREFTDSGGLISYGVSLRDVYRQVGVYAGKILGGAAPGDLPVVQASKFELVINLKTAKALGLAVPQSILVAADEVIE
jgi:putative ABC transport system substrate-binding protein